MSENRKTAVISLLIVAVLFLLTAFSNGAAGEEATGTMPSQSQEMLEETTEEVILESTLEIVEETTEEVTEEATEAVTEEETEEATEAVTEESAEELVEETSEEAAQETEEVTEEETEEPAEETSTQTVDYFADQFIVTVTGKTALNVREKPDSGSTWVGKMYEGSGGTIVEVGDGWSKIQSGNVTGWVSNDYILTGEAGREAALEVCELVFEVKSDALKVRSAPTTEEENKVRAIYGGATYPINTIQEDGWIEIEYKEDKFGWVAGEYGVVRYDYATAMTRKEIQDAENAKKKVDVATTHRESTGASADEVYLLACLINCESNHYEGQLAVANVVLNRVKSPKFPNSISEVIYAPGQFSPARSGKLANRLNAGPSASAMQAAQDALNGVNNIGDYMFFRSAKTADLSKYKSYTIVMGNCFYKK